MYSADQFFVSPPLDLFFYSIVNLPESQTIPESYVMSTTHCIRTKTNGFNYSNLQIKLFSQYLVDGLGIRLTLHRFHHLTNKPAHGFGLVFDLGSLIGIISNQLIDH